MLRVTESAFGGKVEAYLTYLDELVEENAISALHSITEISQPSLSQNEQGLVQLKAKQHEPDKVDNLQPL